MIRNSDGRGNSEVGVRASMSCLVSGFAADPPDLRGDFGTRAILAHHDCRHARVGLRHGSLQRITSEQIGIGPALMAVANSSGGVMGKKVDAQSIVVASTATDWYGHEGDILRYVFFHSVALAALMGLLVFLQAYVAPFTSMVVR